MRYCGRGVPRKIPAGGYWFTTMSRIALTCLTALTDSWTTTSTAAQYNGLVASLRDVPVSGSRPGAVATFVKKLNHSSVPWVSVMAYGAKADDSHDDTAAFNKAIADAGPNGIVYVPAGTYKILGQIELNGGSGVNWPARLIGTGAKLSVLHITSASLGVQTAGTIQAARGASVSDLRFVYDQPDVSTYGTFNQYKPVIYVNKLFVDSTHSLERRGTYFHRGGRYERLRIEAAWDGITVSGNFVARPFFGQEVFDDIEMGTLNRGLDLDGLSDSCYINRLRVYPYGLTTSQQVAQQLPGHSVGIYSGRTDDMRVSNSFFLNGRGVDLHAGADKNGPHANFINCSFDGFAHIQIGDGAPATGYAQFTNCHFGNGPPAYPQDTQVTTSYMNVYFTACFFIHVQHTGINCIETHADPTGSHAVYLDNCEFTMNTHDASAITGDATLSIKGCHFYRSAGTYTNPTVDVTGGLATIVDNQAAPLTRGSGVFLALPTDDYHMVANNVVPGWSIIYPATTTKIKSLSNSASSGSYLLGGTNLAGRPTNQTSSTNPTGTTSTAGVMVGLGYTITPTINGKVFVTISGSCVSDTANVGGNVRLRWSTRTPPANGDAVTGAQVGGIAQRQQGSWSAGATSPFSLSGIISTSAGTTIWVDLQQTVVGSGTFSVLNVAGSLFELP